MSSPRTDTGEFMASDAGDMRTHATHSGVLNDCAFSGRIITRS